MKTSQSRPQLSLQDRLCFVLGLSVQEARAIIEKRRVIQPDQIRDRVTLDLATLDRILQNPTIVQQIHLNPNQLTRDQIARIPHLRSERVAIVSKGRPYYVIEELEAATGLSRKLLDQLFVIPPLSFRDQTTDQEITFAPIPGRYIIPAKGDLEATDPAKSAGYVEKVPATETFHFRVVEPSNFEEEQSPHALKAALDGNVHPVLRDVDGFERYLVPGSLDLWFRSEIPAARHLDIIQELGLSVTNSVAQVGYYRVRLTKNPSDRDVIRAVLTVINQAQQKPEIAFAEADQVGFEDFGPDISVKVRDEDLEAEDLFWNYDAIQLSQAHAITKGSPNVTIFIIDSGIRTDHTTLQSALRSDWKTLDLNFDLGVPAEELSPEEQSISHGTKVAGVIGAQGDHEVVYGIAPNCRILPIKISGQAVTPAYGLRAAAIRQALTYLRPGERAVINLSWQTNGEHIGIREALVEARSKDVAVTTSAGNYKSGETQRPDEIHYPSAHTYRYPQLTNLCCVAALGFGDRKASYSYYGQQSITISAPGGEKGASGSGIYTTSTPDQYSYTCGTSFSSPHVAGLIALLFSIKPDLTAEDAIRILRETADSVDAINPTYTGMLGAGRINAQAALEKVAAAEVKTYLITATAGLQGTISPSGLLWVKQGEDQTFTIAPDPNYQIQTLLVDGNSVEATTLYTFSEVTATHTIAVEFALKVSTEPNHYDELGRLKINLATREEYMKLPYIGSWFANRIMNYRTTYGTFSSIWGLANAGVSAWTIGQIKPLITV
jgi:DNA uptake protein ComE-like DNA-binding protein